MKTTVFGYSSLDLPIIAYEFRHQGPEILILGGVHGDEPEGVIAATGLLESFLISYPYKLNLTLIPQFNIDGVLAKTRTNGNGVDLNRNMPTKDWSAEYKTPRYFPGTHAGCEPENQALLRYLHHYHPQMILSLHSWFPVLNVNGDCMEEAKCLANWIGYKIDTDIGYPTPGSLGTYAGLERPHSTLTYEIERGLSAERILNVHVPAILEMLKVYEKRKPHGK